MREGSNETRTFIYSESLKFMWSQNPIFGTGIKPIMKKELGIPYPLGSHSALVGAFVRFGLIGGIILLTFYILIIFSYIFYLINVLSNKKSLMNNKHFFLRSSTVLISLLFLTEDFDAIENIPFLTGACVGIILTDYKNK